MQSNLSQEHRASLAYSNTFCRHSGIGFRAMAWSGDMIDLIPAGAEAYGHLWARQRSADVGV